MYNPLSLGHWRPVLSHQPPSVTDVALTYDDGPSPASTPQLLTILDRAGVKATFFLTGPRVAAHPDLAAEIVQAGHAVYGHAWDHVNLEEMGPGRALDGMRRVEELLARFRPTPSPYLLRLPYNAGYNRSWMHRAMASFHSDVRFAWCRLNSRDFDIVNGCHSEAELEARCRDAAKRMGGFPHLAGSLVLLHDDPIGVSGPLVPQLARTLLPFVLEAIASRGLRAGPIRTEAHHRLRDRFLLLNAGGDVPLWRPPQSVTAAAGPHRHAPGGDQPARKRAFGLHSA